jgi:exosortase A-associated hydrolase 2
VTAAPTFISRNPFFLPRPSGDLFALHYSSRSARPAAGGAVFLYPFAEEMNRSRRMAALQASALADAGIETLLVDLHGCGDSSGDFGDATWPLWIDGAHAAVEWMAERVKDRVAIVGLRLGAVLAAELAVRYPNMVSRLVLWQPVLIGKTALTQFLRIRLAASLTGLANRETTESLRGVLAAGEAVEIAGYDLSPALAQAVDALTLEALAPPPAVPVDWFEIVSDTEQPVPPASMKLAESWRRRGARVEFRTTVGEPFWATQETAVAPQLLNATTRLFEQVPA